MSVLQRAWKDVDGELVYIQEGESGVGILGPNHTRVPGMDRTISDDLSVSEDFITDEILTELSYDDTTNILSYKDESEIVKNIDLSGLNQVPQRVDISQPSHGLTLPPSGVLLVTYNNGLGVYEPATAASDITAADLFVVGIPDDNTLTITEGGLLNSPSHGLNVGEWYFLAENGLVESGLTLTNDRVQYALFVIDSDNIALRLEPMDDNSFIPPQPELVGTPNQQGLNPTVQGTSGTSRSMVVAFNHESSLETTITSVTYGGQPLTIVVESSLVNTFQNYSVLYYLLENAIQNVQGNDLVVTYSNGEPTESRQVFTNFYTGVSQVDAISDSSFNGVLAANTISTPVEEIKNGITLVSASSGVGGVFTIIGNYPNLQQTNTGGAAHLFASRTAPDNNTENVTLNFSVTSNRLTIVAAHLGAV